MDTVSIRPFTLTIPDSEISDLYLRLRGTRWPPNETVSDWDQGVPTDAMKILLHHWLTTYDWRKCEAWFNSYPQFLADIDGQSIHFLHIKSDHANTLPLLLLHGWPGSVLEFRKVIEPLVNESSAQPFDLVIPSLPGYAWSSKPTEAGWNLKRMSDAFVALMHGLGYRKWVAQGGDWGADIVARMASEDPPSSLAAVHMNTAFFNAHKEIQGKSVDSGEQLALEKEREWNTKEYGYFLEQKTRPQTMGYLLADSPVGQAAWIYEKIHIWAERASDGFLQSLTKDEILDNIMVYWLSNTGCSSARLYWEDDDNTALPIAIPVGVSLFPGDMSYAPRKWGERYYSNIVHWRDVERGGHFAAWEVPDLFVREIRETFKHVR